MSLSRRATLRILGGGAVLAASTAVAAEITRRPRSALDPWAQAGLYEEPRRRALSHAILAPNPHNQQPWMVDLATDGEITLYADPNRLLPHTDPFSRQIVIGLGCFLETLDLALREDGFGSDITLFPEGSHPERLDTRPIARISLIAGAGMPDPLFSMVPHRRTQKVPYDLTRPVRPETLESLRGAIAHGSGWGATLDPDRVADLRRISSDAFEIEFATPRTYRESVHLFRIGAREVDANPDGLDFTGPVFETLRLTRLFTRDGSMDTDSIAFRSGLEGILENMNTAMGHFWMTTPGNSRAEQIAAGRDWMRVHLAATEAGLSLQPLSQALQEYPEMSALYDEVHQKLAPDGSVVQMWARVGYSEEVPESPRWPIDAKILDA